MLLGSEKAKIQRCLSEPEKLNEWEHGYLERLDSLHVRVELSEKQVKQINKIYSKVTSGVVSELQRARYEAASVFGSDKQSGKRKERYTNQSRRCGPANH